jgi:hypothetical protein
MAQQVNHLQAAANFFWDPPKPWVHSLTHRGAFQLDASPYATSSVLQQLPLWLLPLGPPNALLWTSFLLDLPPNL